MDRRQFIHRATLLSTAAVFGGCRHDDPPLGDCPNLAAMPGLLVPKTTRVNTAGSPLRIDMHSHIFNGHDVPIRDYFVRASLHAPPPLDELLKLILVPAEAIIRSLAPTAKKEYEQLCDLLAMASTPGINALESTESAIRLEISADNDAFAGAIAPIANQEPFRSRYREAQLQQLETLGIQSELDVNDEIPVEEIAGALEYRSIQPALEDQGFGITGAARVWAFLKRIASRRYHNAFRLMELYGDAAGPVDIFACATVDYDASLLPSSPSTTIADQIRLMEAIAILSNGRILPLVGYDPRRDVASDGQALADVQRAVTQHGHVGVKLYPPMGFAAYGNKTSNLDCEWPGDSGYGERLDKRLAALYQWSVDQGVPLLAHSNTSNGITKSCEANGSFEDWGRALSTFPGLRACAGHFGGLPKSNDGLTPRMQGFIDLIKKPEAKGFFADLAYLPEMFPEGSASGEALAEQMFEETALGKVADHLVYGSDWYMIAQSPSEPSYARDAESYLRRAGGDALVDAVMGANPARLLGLAAGDAPQPESAGTDYFSQKGITPHWREKLL